MPYRALESRSKGKEPWGHQPMVAPRINTKLGGKKRRHKDRLPKTITLLAGTDPIRQRRRTRRPLSEQGKHCWQHGERATQRTVFKSLVTRPLSSALLPSYPETQQPSAIDTETRKNKTETTPTIQTQTHVPSSGNTPCLPPLGGGRNPALQGVRLQVRLTLAVARLWEEQCRSQALRQPRRAQHRLGRHLPRV